MRKLYLLLSGLVFSLGLSFLHVNDAHAQNSGVCTADFERAPTTTDNPLTVGFRALPWHAENKRPEEICWHFGDGHDTCITYNPNEPNNYYVSHHYAQPGTYNVCIRIRYQGGCVAEKCKTTQVTQPDECRADFERINTIANPLLVYYKALPWHNNGKKPMKICWRFGDGKDTCINYPENYTGQYAVSHHYAQPGLYEVCVKIIYYGGCEAYKCKNIQVGEPDHCSADFERIMSTTNNPLNVYYRALPWHNHNKKPMRICWKFGDGKDTCINYPENYTGQYVVSHHYNHPGLYEVCVRIVYYGGCEAGKCKNVLVGDPERCRADFETSMIASTPLGRHFTALPWHIENKKPVLICWNFGDGHDTCIQYGPDYNGPYVVNHNYAAPGIYEVCVRIVYQGGCESRKCKVIEVGDPDRCGADFERIPVTTNTNPLLVHYKALPSHNHNKKPMKICWRFGDGTDTCINYGQDYNGNYTVAHQYQHAGAYEVCVKIIYYGGCEAYKCKPVLVGAQVLCSARLFETVPSIFSLTRTFYVVPNTIVPNNHPVRICWYFGDGEDSCVMVDATSNPPYSMVHTYPAPGVYRACVRVLFSNGCVAEDCREVVIRPHTEICGGYQLDSLVNAHTYSFKGFSIHNPNDNVISWHWTFGDGSIGNGQQVTHSYNAPGEYRVCLFINTEKGCESKICNTVRVAGNTTAILHLSPNPVVNILNAEFYSTHNETVNIKIINSNGVVVRSYTRIAVVGLNNWSFNDVGTLATGIYSFVVQSPNQFASAIFFKQ